MIHESCKRAVVEMLRELAARWRKSAGYAAGQYAEAIEDVADAVAAMPVEKQAGDAPEKEVPALVATRQRLEKVELLLLEARRNISALTSDEILGQRIDAILNAAERVGH